ncbi:MAG TPA: flavodoxin domain-containing protein [Kofleriaceae bacterium]
MKILLLFASSHGQTRLISVVIERELRARDCEVVAVDALECRDPPGPAGFDAVIVGSRVQFGRHAPAIIAYLEQHAQVLREMPTALFSVSMAAASGSPDAHAYIESAIERLGWQPTLTASFAGGLPYRKYNWLLRHVMKRIAKGAGHSTDIAHDHEYTDWNRVRKFADEIETLVAKRASRVS